MRLAPTTVGGTRAMATESAYAHANPVSADVVIRSFAGPQLVTIDEPTENLIHKLRGGPTDLTNLVEAVRWRPLRVVEIPAQAIIHCRKDDTRSTQLVLERLTTSRVQVH